MTAPPPGRVRQPEATLAALEATPARAAITRLAELTGLDRIGIPVWQAVRPSSRNLTVSQGKGLTDAQAQVGALMEAIELLHAEDPPTDLVASPQALISRLGYSLADLPGRVGPVPNGPLEWTAARFLDDGSQTYVPRDLVRLDFARTGLCLPWLVATSVGLASGNCAEEAALHGLLERIERHCVVHARVTPPNFAADLLEREPLPRLFQAIQAAGLRASAEDLTDGTLGVPCARVRLHDPADDVVVFGTGCDPLPEFAVAKAMLEAAQSRLTRIVGLRDDVTADDYGVWRVDAVELPKLARPAAYLYRDLGTLGQPHKTLHAVAVLLAQQRLRAIVASVAAVPGIYDVCHVVVPGLNGPT